MAWLDHQPPIVLQQIAYHTRWVLTQRGIDPDDEVPEGFQGGIMPPPNGGGDEDDDENDDDEDEDENGKDASAAATPAPAPAPAKVIKPLMGDDSLFDEQAINAPKQQHILGQPESQQQPASQQVVQPLMPNVGPRFPGQPSWAKKQEVSLENGHFHFGTVNDKVNFRCNGLQAAGW